jgi:N-methylhydantoinase B
MTDVTEHPTAIGDAQLTASDPITTEVVRHALRSAAGQMRRVLMRTAFSQIIYEVVDFACGLYDRQARLLAQARGLCMFLGTLDACVREAVAAVGGEEVLREGDILLYNLPYGTGSHPQDAALVMPCFVDGQVVGYAAVKAHWVDIGGKDVYSTDTIDLHQEGTMFPGVYLFREGRRNDDVWRIILANSRAPRLVNGDVNAKVGAVRTGVRALGAIVERHGPAEFEAATAHMFDHGETKVRRSIDEIPDGRYSAECRLDGNGVVDVEIPFHVAVEIAGSEITIDLRDAPEQQAGPINSPLPGTISAARVALAGLVSAGETPDEGQFRPLTVLTRPGTIFEPVSPAPCFAFWTAQVQLIEGVYRALAPAIPDRLPADSGGDILAVIWWGSRRTSYQARSHDVDEPWIDGAPAPVGQGGHAFGDGASCLMHISEACTRISPAEIWEAKNPWLVERMELAPDSCGPGRHRGGLGVDLHIRVLEDSSVTNVLERTKNPPLGLFDGGQGRANQVLIRHPDGRVEKHGKSTAVPVEKGAGWELHTGGGGGYGPPAERDREAVLDDLTDGYITREHAERFYPHALREAPDHRDRTATPAGWTLPAG